MENYGYRMIDLGRDVPPERVVEVAMEQNIRLVGLSALMTTTLGAMSDTIQALKRAGYPGKIMVGGAVLTPEYAESIGADFYSKDAMGSVRYAERLFAETE